MHSKTVLVTGCGGLIGSEAVVHFERQGTGSSASTTTCGAIFSARRVTRHGISNASKRVRHFESHDRRYSGLTGDRIRSFAAPLRPDHPLRSAALTRQGEGNPSGRFRRECGRHDQSSGSDPSSLPRGSVHPYEHQQGLRRRSQ